MYIQNGTDIRLQVNAGTLTDKSVTVTSLKDDTWHYIVMTIDRDSATGGKIYLDGTQTGSSQDFSSQTASIANARDFYIGQAHTDADSNFTGKIDDVRIYNRELSVTEITRVYGTYNSGGIQVSSLQKGLVAYWDFNGDVKDRTPYGSHGTIVGTVSTTADQKGQADKGRYFNNVSYIDGGNGSNLSLTSNQTWAVWVKPLDIWQNKHIISKVTCCWAGFTLQGGGSAGALYVVLGNIYAGYLGPGGTYVNNVWQHLVVTYDDSINRLTLYKDGAYVNHATVSGSVSQYGGSFKIGRYAAANVNHYYGYMGEVRLYNRALSADEVSLLYEVYY